ncbi:3-dehydroquinate synthase [Lutibacter sp. B2]|nr:3-dehydroquinate synthase [Lutibacter sp. B2]
MKTLKINLIDKSYPIHIKKGLFHNIGKKLKKIYQGKKIALITDENVYKFYGEQINEILQNEEFHVNTIVVEPGEKSKSIEMLQNVYDKLLDFKITRTDLIIALGGGVVGDLAGFVAATFLRGVPFVQIPTSLLAQIDSSVGGKVAVNLPRGKNLIGNFYHPQVVFIDPDFLKTLDARFLYDGMAEVIKYGCIKDKNLFQKLFNYKTKDNLYEHMEEIIYTCCKIKKEVVENDEKDMGERMLLNFGHTIGHAIEKYFNYEKYTHGEAVAIGMYEITKKSEELGITKKGTIDLMKELLIKYNLHYEMKNVDQEKILEAIGLDKKNVGSKLNIVLLKDIGESFIKLVDKEEIKDYI